MIKTAAARALGKSLDTHADEYKYRSVQFRKIRRYKYSTHMNHIWDIINNLGKNNGRK